MIQVAKEERGEKKKWWRGERKRKGGGRGKGREVECVYMILEIAYINSDHLVDK